MLAARRNDAGKTSVAALALRDLRRFVKAGPATPGPRAGLCGGSTVRVSPRGKVIVRGPQAKPWPV